MIKMFLSVVVAVLVLCLAPIQSHAVGTVTETWDNLSNGWWMWNITWAAGALGVVTAEALDPFNGMIYSCETIPVTTGADAPQDQYDITIVDARGLDVMASSLLNRATATKQLVFPTNTAWMVGVPTFTLINNNVATATGEVHCLVIKFKD